MIVLMTSDLMMASTANSHARQQGVKLVQANSIDSAIEVIRDQRPQLLLVDLQMSGLDIPNLGEEVSQLPDSVAPLTIAYAQHVEVGMLEQAREAGFDQVLTRGQVNAQMGNLVAGVK